MFKALFDLFEMIYDEGVKEWLDEDRFTNALNELYVSLENGTIDEEEYEKQEGEILEQLKEIREYKRTHPGLDD